MPSPRTHWTNRRSRTPRPSGLREAPYLVLEKISLQERQCHYPHGVGGRATAIGGASDAPSAWPSCWWGRCWQCFPPSAMKSSVPRSGRFRLRHRQESGWVRFAMRSRGSSWNTTGIQSGHSRLPTQAASLPMRSPLPSTGDSWSAKVVPRFSVIRVLRGSTRSAARWDVGRLLTRPLPFTSAV